MCIITISKRRRKKKRVANEWNGVLENLKKSNGIWLRVEKRVTLCVDKSGHFVEEVGRGSAHGRKTVDRVEK